MHLGRRTHAVVIQAQASARTAGSRGSEAQLHGMGFTRSEHECPASRDHGELRHIRTELPGTRNRYRASAAVAYHGGDDGILYPTDEHRSEIHQVREHLDLW